MLVLTRKVTEKIFIGNDITLVLLEINGNQVKLGIDAPHEITILREEVYDRNQIGNKENLK